VREGRGQRHVPRDYRPARPDREYCEIIAQLAPTGVLRAGINLSNFLLVTGRTPAGEPEGVAPDMARAVAERLGVPVRYVPYPRPGELADAAGTGAWDIGLIGAEPQRAEKIAFSPAYAEIEATYLVPPGSPITAIEEVDRPGTRIAVAARRLRPLARAQHPPRHAGPRAEPRRRLPHLRRAEAGGAGRAATEAADRRREAAGRAHPRGQVHGGAAGDRHGARERRRRRLPARLRRGGEGVRPGRAADRAHQVRGLSVAPALGRSTRRRETFLLGAALRHAIHVPCPSPFQQDERPAQERLAAAAC
jgi:hypothetical protein